MVLSCTLHFFFLNFWAIYEFSWFYSIYFWILVVTCSYESLEGFHARFEIFIWAMIPNWSWNWESWQNSGLSEIWHSERSAGKRRTVRRSWELFTRGSAEKFSTWKLHSGRSAKGPRTVRGSSVHPASFGYTGGMPLSKKRTVRRRSADSPPVFGRIYQRQDSVGWQCKDSKADGPPGYRGQSATGQKGGVGQTWLILVVSLTPLHQTTHKHQKGLSLSLSSTWGRRQDQGFLAWFPDGPRTSPDSSQDCASCPLGILTNP